MISPIHHMSVIRYYPDVRWDAEEVISPAWSDVETAIRRMENNFFPIVLLNTTEDEEFEGIFNICGGAGRWALFQMMGDWQYEETGGGEEVVRLWESDQGYFCKEKNVITDIDKVMQITKIFYETGSYENLGLSRET